MKALNTVNIDGHEIITSITPAADFIDPVATEKQVMPILLKSDVQKQIDERLKQIAVYTRQIQQSRAAAKKSTTPQESAQHVADIQLRQTQIGDIQKELIPLNKQREDLRRSLVHEHAVYFKTPERTRLISDDEAAGIDTKLIEAAGKGCHVKTDKTEISDLRGKIYFKKSGAEWFKFQMHKLGDVPPSGAILDADVTPEQRAEIAAQDEAKRIQALKPADREAEKTNRIESIISEADRMRARLEITGGSNPLKTAQDWYKTEKAKVEQKYA